MSAPRRPSGTELAALAAEVDDTGQDLFAFCVRDGVFRFELRRKS